MSKVHVSPYDYDVDYDENLNEHGLNGLHGGDVLRILVNPACAPLIQAETLLHEVLHACWTQTHLDGKYTDEQEEEFVFTMSPRIFAFLRDNPKVVKEWLRI